MYTHDGEDQPEDETHQQHIKDGRDRLYERVHHHLSPHRHVIHQLGEALSHTELTYNHVRLVEQRIDPKQVLSQVQVPCSGSSYFDLLFDWFGDYVNDTDLNETGQYLHCLEWIIY